MMTISLPRWRAWHALPAAVLLFSCSAPGTGPNSPNVSGPFDWTFVFDEVLAGRPGRRYVHARVDISENPSRNSACPNDVVVTMVGTLSRLPSRLSSSTETGALNGSYVRGAAPCRAGEHGITMTIRFSGSDTYHLRDMTAAELSSLSPGRSSPYHWWSAYSGHQTNPYYDALGPLNGKTGRRDHVQGWYYLAQGTRTGPFFVVGGLLDYRPDTHFEVEYVNDTGNQLSLGVLLNWDHLYSGILLGVGERAFQTERRVDSTTFAFSVVPGEYTFRLGAVTLATCTADANTPDIVRVRLLQATEHGGQCDIWPNADDFVLTVQSQVFVPEGLGGNLAIRLAHVGTHRAPVDVSVISTVPGLLFAPSPVRIDPTTSLPTRIDVTSMGAPVGRHQVSVLGSDGHRQHYYPVTVDVFRGTLGFTWNIGPNPLVVQAGQAGTTTIQLARSGYAGDFTLQLGTSAIPATVSPSVLRPGSGDQATVTVTVPPGLSGTFQVPMWVTTAASRSGVPLTLDVVVPAPPSGRLGIVQGQGQVASAGTTLNVAPRVRVTRLDGQPMVGVRVDFSVQGGGGVLAVPGIAATGPQASVTVDANGEASVGWTLGSVPGPNELSASTAAPGIYPSAVTFSATGIAPPPSTFGLALSPSSLSLGPFELRTVTINLTRTDHAGDVTLTFSGSRHLVLNPPWPTSIPAGASSATFKFQVHHTAPTGAHALTVTASGGGSTRTATLSVNVTGFDISVSPAQLTITAGGTASATMTVTRNGYDGPIALVFTGVQGITVTAGQDPIPAGVNSVPLTVTVPANAAKGTHDVSIWAGGGVLARIAGISVVVP